MSRTRRRQQPDPEREIPPCVGFGMYAGRRPGERAADVLARYGFPRAAQRIPRMSLREFDRAMEPVLKRAGGGALAWALELCPDAKLAEWVNQVPAAPNL